jgi:hypothetical protein
VHLVRVVALDEAGLPAAAWQELAQFLLLDARQDGGVEVHVDKILARSRAPVPDHQRLHVRQLQRPFQQRIIVEVELADRQIVGGPPVRVHPVHQFR